MLRDRSNVNVLSPHVGARDPQVAGRGHHHPIVGELAGDFARQQVVT